jgi:hypothetical protein
VVTSWAEAAAGRARTKSVVETARRALRVILMPLQRVYVGRDEADVSLFPRSGVHRGALTRRDFESFDDHFSYVVFSEQLK